VREEHADRGGGGGLRVLYSCSGAISVQATRYRQQFMVVKGGRREKHVSQYLYQYCNRGRGREGVGVGWGGWSLVASSSSSSGPERLVWRVVALCSGRLSSKPPPRDPPRPQDFARAIRQFVRVITVIRRFRSRDPPISLARSANFLLARSTDRLRSRDPGEPQISPARSVDFALGAPPLPLPLIPSRASQPIYPLRAPLWQLAQGDLTTSNLWGLSISPRLTPAQTRERRDSRAHCIARATGLRFEYPRARNSNPNPN